MMTHVEELLLKVLRHWLPYYVLAWLAAAAASAIALYYAHHCFDNPDRQDKNGGHATIDFGGQYLMGRMLVTGNARELYNRAAQRRVLREAYPDEDGNPKERGDVENLMWWTMGSDDPEQQKAIGTFLLPFGATDPLSASLILVTCERKVWAKGRDDKAAEFLLPLGAADPLSASVVLAACKGEGWTQDRAEKAAERRVGGPLYPPINALVYAPLALMPPRTAYHVQQYFNLVLVFVAAAGARYLARGRVWWPVVAAGIMVFPGFAGSINLGQNATLTLAILVWGWALVARGRPVLGGAVWGLLAFKPVWALAFFLVPLLSRRWRVCLAMAASGAALALLTLPFVGLHSWLDWLAIGKEAAALYDVEKNWIFLSRDLLSVPRRWLIDFEKPLGERLDVTLWPDTHWSMPTWVPTLVIGWALVVFVLESTVRLAVLRRRQPAPPDGPPAAFLYLGAWMCCFHFMYYDALLGSLGLFLLFTEPRRYLAPLLVALAPLRNAVAGPAVAAYHRPAVPDALPPPVSLDLTPRGVWALNRMAPTAYFLLVAIQYVFPVLGWGSHWGTPWDTFCLMGVWAWCGWQWLRRGEKVATAWEDGEPEEPAIDVTLVTEEGKNGEAAPPPDERITTSLPAGNAP